jgi:hypothetical protein
VLILNPFGSDDARFSIVALALRTTPARELGEPVDIYEVPRTAHALVWWDEAAAAGE